MASWISQMWVKMLSESHSGFKREVMIEESSGVSDYINALQELQDYFSIPVKNVEDELG